MQGKASNLKGRRFGALRVLHQAPTRNKGSRWMCECECGKSHEVAAASLLRANGTRSCGCAQGGKKHGGARRGAELPEYGIWSGMRDRCNRPANTSYPNYGARGIKVCKRWDDFAAFLADMGPRPTPTHTIDRIDNDGDYTPGNCRWATRAEQSRNARRCKLITHAGRTMTVAEWARELGIPAPTIYGRIYLGWPEERLLT